MSENDRIPAPAGGVARAEILDCTIRDGSYAVDFKFTAADTALVAGQLERAGIRYIEIGHGLGLGAGEAGKGRTPSTDTDAIRATREQVKDGRLGCFFIPGIGTKEHLEAAAEAGLDFVRIGQNADEIEGAWEFVETARELGLEVFVNFMKSYGITPEEFASSSAAAESAGARGTYVVDSAGGMLPGEVREYVLAARAACGLDVGFHGHSNLHLAVANSLAALEAGALLVDTSVYGIGRSSGNVPTEVMAAVLERLGISSGVDVFAVMNIAETHLRPLMEHMTQHDMIAVSLGFGRFHSSYLPRAIAAAQEADVDPFRLIVELGTRDPMRLGDQLLEDVVTELRDRPAPSGQRSGLAEYSDPRFGVRRIGNRRQAVPELIDGLEVVAAKRRLQVALDLVPTSSIDETAIAAEFVTEDDSMALGRVRFGDPEAVGESLGDRAARVDVALLDLEHCPEGERAEIARAVSKPLGGKLLPYRSGLLEIEYLADAAVGLIGAGAESVLVRDPGWYRSQDVDWLVERLSSLGVEVARTTDEVPTVGAPLLVVAGPWGARSAEGLVAGFDAALFIGFQLGADSGPPDGIQVLDRAAAYHGRLSRWLSALGVARRSRAGAHAVT